MMSKSLFRLFPPRTIGSFAATSAADYTFRADGGVSFSFATQQQVSNSGITDARNTYTNVNNTKFSGNLTGFWRVAIPLTFGQAFSINADLVTTASALAGSNSTANSAANFGNSIYWGGISSITLADGSTTTASTHRRITMNITTVKRNVMRQGRCSGFAGAN